MRTKVSYNNGFKKNIECITIQLSDEQCITFIPKSRTIETEDGTEINEDYVDVKIYDERFSYEEVFEANRNEITDIIKVLGELKAQLKSNNTYEQSCK